MSTQTQARGDEFVAAAEKHLNLDMLVKDQYGEIDDGKFQGCSVGCFAYEIDPILSNFQAHKLVANHYGYPEWLAYLQDEIFENGGGAKWHVEFARGVRAFIAAGGDWNVFEHRVLAGILQISLRHAGEHFGVVADVIDLHNRAASGGTVSLEEFSAAMSSAYAAESSEGSYAVRAAVRAASWGAQRSAELGAKTVATSYAARATAMSSAYAAESSEGSYAAMSAARSSARAAAWSEIRSIVLTLLNSEEPA